MLRKPSHFGSYDAPGGIVLTGLASIGDTGGITGSCMPPFWPATPTRTRTVRLQPMLRLSSD